MSGSVALRASPQDRRLAIGIALAILSVLYLELLGTTSPGTGGWQESLLRAVVVAVALIAAVVARPIESEVHKWFLPWTGVGILAATIAAWLAYAMTAATAVAWVAIIGLLPISWWACEIVVDGRRSFLAWVLRGVLGLGFVLFPVALVQISSHFGQEEFFAAFQVVLLGILWLILEIAVQFLWSARKGPLARGPRIRSQWLAGGLTLLFIVEIAATLRAYQSSSYPQRAPTFPGLSAANPFLCSSAPGEGQAYDGFEVQKELLSAVQDNPRKGSPELGMLALATGDATWASAFRQSLLQEAKAGKYTGPANSVKSVQYDAALRAYYYPRVARAFAGLFSPQEDQTIRAWFAAINRRAMTVEWVDLLYGLAFSKWPEGPYENQDNGAGLLALLQSGGLAAPELEQANQQYLTRVPRGWSEGFRNTDDALIYQLQWINNAYFESLDLGPAPQANIAKAFEWLRLQAVPDGTPLGYNSPTSPSLAGTAYLGAVLLGDPRYIWLSGRALEYLQAQKGYLNAQPGAEQFVNLRGEAPVDGSCLLFGDSGLPNQSGPLAPDKIVFRNGWSSESLYTLLNLRFSGWHRYKATGTVTLVYAGQPLALDRQDTPKLGWLPVGRSLMRDKRLPREDLNGLLVEDSGMASALHALTGVGDVWAQDPPYYAQVEGFEPGPGYDMAKVSIPDWHGWSQTRTVLSYRDGVIAVVDHARGPSRARAALAWHFPAGTRFQGNHLTIASGGQLATAVFLPLSPGRLTFQEQATGAAGRTSDLLFEGEGTGEIDAITVFLTGPWALGEVSLASDLSSLTVAAKAGKILVSLPGE